MDRLGNLYITKGEAENGYPILVCHLDQVQTLHSNDIEVRRDCRCVMEEKEISQIIGLVFALAAKTVTHLKAEKKATGDYSKSVTFEDAGYEIRFEAVQNRGSYPPIPTNLTFFVNVARDGVHLMVCQVIPINNKYVHNYSAVNCDKKFKMWAVVCDKSKMRTLFHSGDNICVDNKRKVAFAKAEILSEKVKSECHGLLVSSVIRKLRLTKELGHHETLAFKTGYPSHVATYVADESTEEYYGGKDVLERDIVMSFRHEPVEQNGLVWYEYTCEDVSYNSQIQLTTPINEVEMTMQLKRKALEELLEDCQGEFCYGDPRVQKYKEHYLILGEEIIDRIHDAYLAWLKENCTTFVQDAASGELTGITIDWNGKEGQQPDFWDYLLTDELPLVKKN